MTRLSWSDRNSGRHGILLPFDDDDHLNQIPPNETFFSSRIKMYLDLLDCIPLSESWISSLSHIDINKTIINTEVTVPPSNIGRDCPICYDPYVRIADDGKSPTTTTTKTNDWERKREIPVGLPCGHILCEKCVCKLAWLANASTGVLCPFCRASFNHIILSMTSTAAAAAAGSDSDSNSDSGSSWWDMLLKCMWVTLEIYIRLQYDKEDEQDMESVLRWAQDGDRLSHDVPSADKREAIQYALKSWLEMGDERFCQELAVTVLGPTVQVTPPLVRLLSRAHAHRRARPRRALTTNGRPTDVLIRTAGAMRISRSQDFSAF